MINVENEVFSTVATALRAEFPGIFVAGETVAAPSTFPAVMLMEQDNSTYRRTMELSGLENHAKVMYQVEIYSNKSSGKKAECKAILAIIDAEMQRMGFLRIGGGPMPIPNADATKYRMVARYSAVINRSGAIHKIT